MKKTIIVFLCSLSVFAFDNYSNAAPRNRFDVTKIYTNEGDTRTPIGVALSSTSWTQVLPASTSRRAAILQTLSTADEMVCLSTTTSSATTCTSTTKGLRIEKGAAMVDNCESVLYGKVATGTVTATAYSVYIYGMIYSDSKDSEDDSR
jgi:hypothetical protein